jgi:uroporphyrinogen-III synthase
MRHPLALIRPEPGWSASAEAAGKLGLQVVGEPLFAAEPVAWDPPEGPFDALLAGSAAVFRHGGPALTELTHLPVLAVGEATATAARLAGFQVRQTGMLGIQPLLDGCSSRFHRLLRLAGEERVRLRPRPGVKLHEIAIYRLRSLPVSPAFAAQIQSERPLIALHSAAAVRHMEDELARLGIAPSDLPGLALGPRIARAATRGWAALHVAERPTDAALLAMAASLCK